MSLPDELLLAVVSFLGRTPLRPSPQPWPFLSSCRRLYELSQDSTTRVEFLLANFGAKDVLQGLWSWTKLVSPDVLSLLIHRSASNPSEKVPRFHLQRLYQLAVDTGRVDLLLPTLTLGAQLYPKVPPTTRGWDGRGFNPLMPDELVFKDLVTTSDTTSVRKDCLYLVEESKAEDWFDPADLPLSALLTLKYKYGFDPNFNFGGRVTLSEKNPLVNVDVDVDDNSPPDMGIEGINAGYLLLAYAISQGLLLSVRRLLRLGVSLERKDPDSFFWKSMDAVRNHVRSLGKQEYVENDDDVDYVRSIWGYRRRDAARGLLSWYDSCYTNSLPASIPSDTVIFEDLMASRQATVAPDIDAEEVAADIIELVLCDEFSLREETAEQLLRAVLEHAQETGWLRSQVARESVDASILRTMEDDRMRLAAVLQQYKKNALEDSGTASGVNLVSALCAENIQLAETLVEEGDRLDDGQLISILRSRNLPQAHTLLVETYPFNGKQLESVLTAIANTENRYGHEDLQRSADTVLRFLENRGKDFVDRTGKKFALQLFESPKLLWIRPHLRAFLGPLDRSGPKKNAMSVLLYDLLLAAKDGNAAEIKNLRNLGAIVEAKDFYTYFPRFSFPKTFDAIAAFIEQQGYTSDDLGGILLDYFNDVPAFVEWLLDPRRKVKPTITSQALRNCMSNMHAQNSLSTFRKLLLTAASQPKIVDKPKLVRKMAVKRGGEWEAAWEVYEKKYSTQ